MEGIYLVMLSKDTPSPFLPKDDQVNAGGEQPKDAPKDAPKDKKGKAKVTLLPNGGLILCR